MPKYCFFTDISIKDRAGERRHVEFKLEIQALNLREAKFFLDEMVKNPDKWAYYTEEEQPD